MVKINISDLKSNEDSKIQLKRKIAEVREEVKNLIQNSLNPRLEEAKKSVSDSLESFFNGEGYSVKPNGEYGLIAKYGEQEIMISFNDNVISVLHNGKEVEKIIISNNRGSGGITTTSISRSSNKNQEIINLELELESLQNQADNLKDFKLYYHYSYGIDLDFSNVIANIFK